mmetsp:Transcript_33275/g.53620  ORF Transcript_33275/g.53620 Transcript_33275/m.53620 type:complete len:495 (-) Transcript_33275:8947-10431(-)
MRRLIGRALLPSRHHGHVRYFSSSGQKYNLTITTGNRRGASTTAQVFVQLRGEDAQTQRILVEGDFVRDSVVKRTITTPVSLGQLRSVRVGHDNVGEKGVGWYLESVQVKYEGDAKPEEFRFPVQRWLGKSDIGVGTYPASVSLKVRMMDSLVDPEAMVFPVANKKPKPLFLETGAAAFPHPDKVRAGERAVVRSDIGQAGEDAYSISAVIHPGDLKDQFKSEEWKKALQKLPLPSTVTVCVADGVFQWREKGIDAGEWSRFLVRTVRHQSQHHVRDEETSVENKDYNGDAWYDMYTSMDLPIPMVPLPHPKKLLEIAETKLGETTIQGSSTACIACVHGIDNRMYVACLGDSGICLYRKGKGLIFHTPEQEHSFGYPFQLGHHEASDKASDALVAHMGVQKGDVVIVASDGLFDNVSQTEIANIVSKHSNSRSKHATMKAATVCANELAGTAFTNSMDKTKDSPWAEMASEEYNLVWHGGKKDDVTVVCIVVK